MKAVRPTERRSKGRPRPPVDTRLDSGVEASNEGRNEKRVIAAVKILLFTGSHLSLRLAFAPLQFLSSLRHAAVADASAVSVAVAVASAT